MSQKTLLKFSFLLFFIVAALFLTHFFFPEGVSIDAIRQVVSAQGVWGPLIFVGAYSIAVIAFLPASPFSLISGALFGPLWGTVYIIIAATIGALAAFLLARFFGREAVSFLVERYAKKIAPFDERLARQGFMTVLTLRLIPVFPFNALNFLLGLTKVRTHTYFFATAIGIIPGAFVFAYAGATAAEPSLEKVLMAAGIFGALVFARPLYKLVIRLRS